MEVLAQIAKDPTRAVLVVTHDPRILPFANRIVRIEDGRIVGEERGGEKPASETFTGETLTSEKLTIETVPGEERGLEGEGGIAAKRKRMQR